MQLEEGEIEDDSNDGLDPYTPLERPDLAVHKEEVIPDEDSDKESLRKYSSSDDSDSDLIPKRAKLRRVSVRPQPPPKAKKYTVWCRDPNDHLTDFLGSFGMRNRLHDRNVENYTVPTDIDRKRKVPVRKAVTRDPKLKPILLPELETNELNSFDEVAQDIAEKLSETNKELVLRIVVVCGKQKAIELYNKTREIEKNGGMLIANQSRRRTSGGIFIFLVRKDDGITQSQKNEIFEESNERSKLFKKYRKRKLKQQNFKEWLKQMNFDKGTESGQEELSNPPPSPEPHCPQPLVELKLRKELLTYEDLNLGINDSPDVLEGSSCCQNQESPQKNPVMSDEELPEACEETSPQNVFKHKASPVHNEKEPESPARVDTSREVVDYDDDLYSMEQMYD